jgi:hypothetical protein
LKPAEDMLGGSDPMIDAEKAAKMSRPQAPADANAKKPAALRANPPPATGAAPAIGASGNNGDASTGQAKPSPAPGEPPRKVRIILPSPNQQGQPTPSAEPTQSAQP